jgi:dTDP-4-dehydrorhamnose reductase
MKILVTGRHGQLARSLAERAAASGVAVELVGRPDIDLAVEGSARSAIVAARPDLVINTAAFTAVDQAEHDEALALRINGEAAGEVAAAAAEIGAGVIQLSTDYVFDGAAIAPLNEEAPTAPINVYGRSKLAGEQAVRSANPAHLILRTSWLLSPFGRNFVRTMVDLGLERDRLTVVADQRGNPTSALDLADAIIHVARRWHSVGKGETYHLAGSGIASWFDVAEAVHAELARLGRDPAKVDPIATADWPTPARRPAYSALDSGKFERDFGWTMPDWRVSLPAIVERILT